MRLILKPWQGQVGLGLQDHSFDAALHLCGQLRHPPAIQQIGHERRDKHGLTRPRKTGDAKAQRRFEKAGHRGGHAFDAARDAVGQSRENHAVILYLVSLNIWLLRGAL